MKPLRFTSPHPVRRVKAPPMPGPFVNANLLSLGKDRSGVERFWTSTWNAESGSLGILADETGHMRVYRFGLPHKGFYSAAPENPNTLWLCGDLSRFVRLRLETGKFKCFPTKAVPTTMTFAGMAFDRPTRRLFCGGILSSGAEFDTRTKKAVLFKDQWKSRNLYASFPNGDGTWSLIFYFPGALMCWDPRTHEVTKTRVPLSKAPLSMLYRVTHVEGLGWYLPNLGWYDPAHRKLRRGGPRPEREMMWFARFNGRLFGAEKTESDLRVASWDTDTGRVENRLVIPDTPLQGIALTQSGKLLAMSSDGVLRLYEAGDGGLRLAREAPAKSVGAVDCLRLTADHGLVGTTFITQRFWEADLRTGRARDCGRAAPGSGEILKTWRIGKRIYMAAYTGGELVEYDPARPGGFPANPRVVAHHPQAMRPVAAARHGTVLWYGCSRKYGHLGCVLFRYETKTGRAYWSVDPLGPRMVSGLIYHRPSHSLICGSHVRADQNTADPEVKEAMLGIVDADTLAPVNTRQLPSPHLNVIGWMGKDRFLVHMQNSATQTFAVFTVPDLRRVEAYAPPAILQNFRQRPSRAMAYAGRPGRFVIETGDRLELHDLKKQESLLRVIAKGLPPERTHWELDGRHLLVALPGGDVRVVENVL